MSFIGRKVEAAIAFEASRGVGAAPVYSLGKVDFSLYDKTVDARQNESIGRIEDSNRRFVVEKYAQGQIGGYLGGNSALYILGLAFGATPSVGSVSDSVYPWTLGVDNDNQHASGALLVKDGNTTLMYKLLMLENLQIEVDLEGMVMWTAEFIAKQGVTSGQSMPTYVEDYKFTKRLAKIKRASSVAGLGAASALPLKAFQMTINKNLVRDSEIGTVEPTDILNREMSIEGNFTLNYEDQTYRNLMKDATLEALRISFESEQNIGSTTPASIEIDLAAVDYFGWEADTQNPEIVMNDINFKANYDLTNGMVESVTVSNALSSS